jgi:hypothetical protein
MIGLNWLHWEHALPARGERCDTLRCAGGPGSRALPASPRGRAWTDDYSNIVQAMSWTKAFSR